MKGSSCLFVFSGSFLPEGLFNERSAAAGKLDGLADIGGGRERHQTSLGVSRDVESGNEGTDRFLINAVLAARERLELLVGVRHSVTAHDGLHGFGQHFPSSVEVGSNLSFIDLKLAETAFECAVPDK